MPVTTTPARRPDHGAPVAPRLATRRDRSRPTDGAVGAFVAHLHRRPWLPWQRLAADLAGERNPDGSYAYPIVVVTVPRQCGKTTWALDLALGRCLQQPDYRAAYTAQTGHTVTERFRERMDELTGGPMAPVIRTRRSQGTERLDATAAAYVKAFPPKDGALRGSALDLVIVDEAQEHGTAAGVALDHTILPVFTTRRRRQLILVGTAGTDRSDYLARYLTAARNGEPGYAVVEYGAQRGDDYDDPDTWWLRHPGLGRLADLEALTTARTAMGPAAFAREYLNVWSRVRDRSVDPADWQAVQDETSEPVGQVCVGFDVTPDRAAAAVGLADAGVHVELLDQQPGTDWLVARLTQLAADHDARVACARYGAAGPTVDALERAGVPLLPMTGGDAANAAASITDAIATRTLRVRPSEALTEAVAGAATRRLGDTGGFAWSRRDSAGPVAALVAVSAARWGAQRTDPPTRPAVYAM